VKLTTQQARELLEKRGSYITEFCDACGRGIGPVRFTRRADSGVGDIVKAKLAATNPPVGSNS
jgi:hypothetical protein